MHKYQGSDIEMANEQLKRPKEMIDIMAMNLVNIETKFLARCADANRAYDVLLGMD